MNTFELPTKYLHVTCFGIGHVGFLMNDDALIAVERVEAEKQLETYKPLFPYRCGILEDARSVKCTMNELNGVPVDCCYFISVQTAMQLGVVGDEDKIVLEDAVLSN